jgi:hypothetical protein
MLALFAATLLSQSHQTVMVHIESDRPVELRRLLYAPWIARANFYNPDETVCSGACNRYVTFTEQENDFFITGDGVTDSSSFVLSDQGPEVTLKVRAGDRGRKIVGKILLIGGPIAMGGGALGAALTYADPQQDLKWVFVGVAAAGFAMLVTGIVLTIVERTVVRLVSVPQEVAR